MPSRSSHRWRSTETAKALVAAAVENFGRLDVIVTNAGILRDKVLWKMTDDDFDAVINVHLRGTFTCVREAVAQFREQGDGGRIICIGSPAGQRGNFGQTNYAAAKAGIVGMVRTWAMELQRAGITANAVSPVAATAMTETIPFLAPYIEGMRKGEPLPPVIRREVGMGTPEDVAGVISFLASDAAADVTGQAISIGGDRLALWSHPQLTATAFHDNGFSADDVAAEWPATFAGQLQSVGEEFPAEVLNEMTRYEYGIDFDAVEAIDIHTHVEIDGCGHRSMDDELMAASEKYFKSGEERDPDHRVHRRALPLAQPRGRRVHRRRRLGDRARAPTRSRRSPSAPRSHNDVLIPFGSVDPWQGKAAVRRVHRLVDEFGVKGFKFHPSMQGFEPNDRRFYPVYEAIAEAGRPGPVPHRADGHRRRYCPADTASSCATRIRSARRRRRRLPRPDDRDGAPGGAVGRHADLHRDAQGERLHRPVRVVAEVLPAAAGARPRTRCCAPRCCSAPTSP